MGIDTNLFDKTSLEIEENKFINVDGNLRDSSIGSVSHLIPVIPNQTINIKPIITYSWYYNVYDANATKIGTYSLANLEEISIPNNGYYLRITFETNNIDKLKLSYSEHELGLKIALDEIRREYNKSECNIVFNELGGYTTPSAAAAILRKDANTDRVRSEKIHAPRIIVVTTKKTCRFVAMFADEDGTNYDSNTRIDTGTVASGTRLAFNVGETNDRYLFTICIASEISVENADTFINVNCYYEKQYPFDQTGKNVFVYKFGGKGNDWCFVRTPDGYNPKNPTPYPFVICNHGNGWVMDGTIQKANWTKRTMYVPLDDADYIAAPEQYNGTSDESLLYSNPTIEALLTAGYVVCGCENYADNLYGNGNCRNACVDFYHHMVDNYNVEKRCCMIGASNGAMTSLNAAYLLQGAVKAMVLQYPLTCLLNQYNNNTNHRAGIRTAYGITSSSPTQDELANAFRTHDPLTTDVVNGIKIGVIPPIKFWYSEDDTVVNYQQNTLALSELLDDSNKVVEVVQASGGHGDYTHFDPTAVVAWFNEH